MIGGGITNTLDLGAGQKIQDYLAGAGAGVSNQGPGGGTLYTAGGGTAAGGGTIPTQQYSGINIDAQGNITGQKGLGRVTSQLGNIKDLNSFPPELQAAIQSYQQGRPSIDPGRYPTFGNANLGFGSVQNPGGISAMEAGIAGMIPAAEPTPTISQQPIYAADTEDTIYFDPLGIRVNGKVSMTMVSITGGGDVTTTVSANVNAYIYYG